MHQIVMASCTLLVLLLLIFPALFCLEEKQIIVKLEDGDLRGKQMDSTKGTSFLAFLGIPYAEPPEGELRFKPPIAKKPWKSEGVRDATEDAPICTQKDILSNSVIGQEDCLYVNVYTPKISTESKYSVMIWIHGGGFQFGHSSSWMYGPGHLITTDIVLVTFNYRVNALGFLSTGDDASPGNYGLLDQLEVLKWVKRNIRAFGGNPEKITLFGQSAGAASVMNHVLSPLSKDLFHQAILMSGSAICSWAQSQNSLNGIKTLARKVECPTNDTTKLIDCLRKLPAKKLVKLASMKELGLQTFAPTVDGYFVTEKPIELLKKKRYNKVAILAGITKEEGVGIYALSHKKLKPYTEDLLQFTVQQSIHSLDANPEVVALIKKNYLHNTDTRNKVEAAKALSKILSDAYFDLCHYQTIQYLIATGIKSYAYSFDHSSSARMTSLFGIRENLGVGHSDDMLLLFDGRIFNLIPKDKDTTKVQDRIVKLWTNFAKFGNPTVDSDIQWPESKVDNIQVYHIADTDTVQEYDPKKDTRYDFWFKQVPDILNKILKDEL